MAAKIVYRGTQAKDTRWPFRFDICQWQVSFTAFCDRLTNLWGSNLAKIGLD